MIKEVKVFAATCDNCAEEWAIEVHGIPIRTWDDRHHLKDEVEESGWHITARGQCYCDKCHAFDENDTLIIIEEREVKS